MMKKSRILIRFLLVSLLVLGQMPANTMVAKAGEKAAVLSAPAGNSLSYNGADQALVSGGEADTSMEYSLDGKVWSSDIPQEKDANTYTIYYRAAEDADHDPGDAEQITATISKAPLTVSANDHSIIYGDEPDNNGVVYSGFEGNDSENDLTGTLSYSYNYSRYDDAGEDYTITPGGLSAKNYDISCESGKLSVDKKEVGLTWSSSALTYNGKAQAPSAAATGVVNDDDISVVVSGKKTEAGEGYKAIARKLTGDKAGNYKLPEDRSTTFSIIKDDAQVSTEDKTDETTDLGDAATITKDPVVISGLVYNGSEQKLITPGKAKGGTLEYAVNQENIVPDDSEFDEAVPAEMDAGTYYVWYKVFADEDHEDTIPVRLMVEISQKPVRLINMSASKVYDGSVSAKMTADISGVVDGDDLEFKATAYFDSPSAGKKRTVTYEDVKLRGSDAGNYTYAGSDPGTFKAEITKRPLTITADDQKVKVDKSIEKGTDYVHVSNLVKGHRLYSIKLKSSSTDEPTDHGTITPSEAVIKSGNTDVTKNYKIKYVDGRLKVKEKSSDSDSSSGSSGGGSYYISSSGVVVNYNELRGMLQNAIAQITAQKAANGAAGVQQQIVTWDKGDSLPYDVMKTLQDNPNITLVFKCSYGGINYVITIPGSAVVANPLIPWYGPLYLYSQYGQYSTAVPTANASLAPLLIMNNMSQNVNNAGFYVVKRGDTLGKIARQYNTTVANLVALNGIRNRNLIYPGQIIKYTAAAVPVNTLLNTAVNTGVSNTAASNTGSGTANKSSGTAKSSNTSSGSKSSSSSTASGSSASNGNNSSASSANGTQENSSSSASSDAVSGSTSGSDSDNSNVLVWISDDGEQYHSDKSCSDMKNNVRQVTIKEAKDMGRTACKKCNPPE